MGRERSQCIRQKRGSPENRCCSPMARNYGACAYDENVDPLASENSGQPALNRDSHLSGICFFGLPAVLNLYPFASNRSQFLLREGNHLRSGLKTNPFREQIHCVSVVAHCYATTGCQRGLVVLLRIDPPWSPSGERSGAATAVPPVRSVLPCRPSEKITQLSSNGPPNCRPET